MTAETTFCRYCFQRIVLHMISGGVDWWITSRRRSALRSAWYDYYDKLYAGTPMETFIAHRPMEILTAEVLNTREGESD